MGKAILQAACMNWRSSLDLVTIRVTPFLSVSNSCVVAVFGLRRPRSTSAVMRLLACKARYENAVAVLTASVGGLIARRAVCFAFDLAYCSILLGVHQGVESIAPCLRRGAFDYTRRGALNVNVIAFVDRL